jgi:putative SOS response-associated peptidase YedK
LEVETGFKAVIDRPLQFIPQKHINGFDYPKTPVIIDEKPNIITHYNWGLIPSSAKDEEIKKYTLNAKIEMVNEKPSFKNSVDTRCLIIANGY